LDGEGWIERDRWREMEGETWMEKDGWRELDEERGIEGVDDERSLERDE
jgi:hypothetical protein